MIRSPRWMGVALLCGCQPDATRIELHVSASDDASRHDIVVQGEGLERSCRMDTPYEIDTTWCVANTEVLPRTWGYTVLVRGDQSLGTHRRLHVVWQIDGESALDEDVDITWSTGIAVQSDGRTIDARVGTATLVLP